MVCNTIPLPSMVEDSLSLVRVSSVMNQKGNSPLCCCNWDLLIHLPSKSLADFQVASVVAPVGIGETDFGHKFVNCVREPNCFHHSHSPQWMVLEPGSHSKEVSVTLLALELLKNNACLEVLFVLSTSWLSCRKSYCCEQTQSLMIV